jgi:hypothetical protein
MPAPLVVAWRPGEAAGFMSIDNSDRETSDQDSSDPGNSFAAAQKRRRALMLLLAAPGIMICIGLGGAGYGTMKLSEADREAHWPTTDGIISYSYVGDRSTSKVKSYAVLIDYSYKVGDASYHGNNVLDSFGKTESADKLLPSYPSGGKVKVYVNPEDPSLSRLTNADTRAVGWTGQIVGGIFIVIGLIQLAINWFRDR